MDEISGSSVSDTERSYLASAACPLCNDLEIQTGEVEYRSICGDCKFLLMEDLDSPDVRGTRMRRRSFDSADTESQRFSQISDRAGGSTFSDNESDGISDTLYGESESDASSFRVYGALPSEEPADTISFSTNGGGGGDSDASVDGQNSDNFLHSSDQSDSEESSDTDIDPMNVGRVLWNSDNEFEGEDGRHWEEDVENEGNLSEPSRSRFHLHLSSRFDDRNIHMTWRRHASTQGTFQLTILDSFDYREALNQTPGDHLGHGSRKGAAASASFVSRLPRTMINKDDMENAACAICKDPFTVGTHVNQLPCHHIYHPYCILPWLSTRNTCPLCRHELPTDQEYVKGNESNTQNHRIEATNEQEMSDQASSLVTYNITAEPSVEDRGRTHFSSRNRLMFIAAPVIGLLGISLMFWLGGNPFPKRRCRISNRRLW